MWLLLTEGSGGHIAPALSFKNYLEKLEIPVELIGKRNKVSKLLIGEEGLLLNLEKKTILKKENRGELKRLYEEVKKAEVIISFGGFIGFFGGGMAKLLRKPLFIHEANAIFGSSNKVLKNVARNSFSFYPLLNKNNICVGNPSQDKFSKVPLSFKVSRVLCLGGSLGAPKLLDAYLQLGRKFPQFDFTISSGANYENKEKEYPKNIKLLNFVPQDLYRDFDLVLSRAGATSIAEFVSLGIPLILIPSPNVKNNHQTHNALTLFEGNDDYIINEDEKLLSKLSKKINELESYHQREKELKYYQPYQYKNVNERIYLHVKDYLSSIS